MTTQNPYADVVIDGTTPFIVRHGMLLILVFLLLCFFVGTTIKVTDEKKFISTVDLISNKVTDTVKCYFNVNVDDACGLKDDNLVAFATGDSSVNIQNDDISLSEYIFKSLLSLFDFRNNDKIGTVNYAKPF